MNTAAMNTAAMNTCAVTGEVDSFVGVAGCGTALLSAGVVFFYDSQCDCLFVKGSLQRFACAMQARHDGADWTVEGRRNLFVGQAFDVAQQDHAAVGFGQGIEGLLQFCCQQRLQCAFFGLAHGPHARSAHPA